MKAMHHIKEHMQEFYLPLKLKMMQYCIIKSLLK